MRLAMRAALALVLTIGGSSAGPSADQLDTAAADRLVWVELTGSGQQIRAVVPDLACPHVLIDGSSVAMTPRAAPDEAFPERVCQASVPVGARQASFGGRPLPLMTRSPHRILVFGDSGCRLLGAEVQDCNNAAAWPFPAVARSAAAMKPDLVIHVGDYYYRETACPPGRPGCAGSPYGDRWATWRADFFDPAQPLLRTAPFVFARGNHESCGRGGVGWMRLLAAGADVQPCPKVDAAFTIELGDLALYMIDSAEAEDRKATREDVIRISRQLDALGSDLDHRPGWIVTHRPIWAMTPFARLGPIGPAEISLNRTLEAAVRDRALSAVAMVVSGHVHHFASYDFGPARPAQLVAGTGGDSPEDADLRRPRTSAVTLDGLPAQRLTFQRFGYFMLERDLAGGDWTGTFRDLDGAHAAVCRLSGRDLTCKARDSKIWSAF